MHEFTPDEKDRLLDLEARMRGVSKQAILNIAGKDGKIIDLVEFEKNKFKRKIEADELI